LRPEARWPAQLTLQARADSGRTLVHARHEGPLRLLKSLYPEGDGIAHAVIVHPPGGLVGGDRLEMTLDVQAGAHLLATTPAATRFYRSQQLDAVQTVRATVAAGARLEWLPQETLAYSGCRARNSVTVQLQGQLLLGELLALGLTEAGQPWLEGELLQSLAIDGLWLDRGCLRASDRALLEGPCGLAGQRVLGSLVLAQAQPFAPAMVEQLLEAARVDTAGVRSGATLLQGRLLLLRLLAQEVEPAIRLMRAVRGRWRELAWGLRAVEPRIWSS